MQHERGPEAVVSVQIKKLQTFRTIFWVRLRENEEITGDRWREGRQRTAIVAGAPLGVARALAVLLYGDLHPPATVDAIGKLAVGVQRNIRKRLAIVVDCE